MAKFLVQASYTSEGMEGVLKSGGTARVDAVGKMIADLGGQLESLYFAFGETDAFVICDMPDNVTAAAVGMQVAASGAAHCRTVVLITPEEIDRAAGVSVDYRPPGT